jgi:glycosyltransferase involved in cell wall biosynthesis
VKLLTVVVPAYNSAAYLHRCLDSLATAGSDVEVLIIDDGSTDETRQIAQAYASRLPGLMRVIGQANGGHGAAINTGIREASGRYLKVVDSDDWLEPGAYAEVVRTLRELVAGGTAVDAVVCNFVYEKVGKRNAKAVRYRGVMPAGRVFTWEDVGEFATRQYILMHALIYRTDLLRACGLRLPEHTFYVDNLFAYVPLTSTRSLYYLDVDLYRYYIGRSDQSVNEAVMLTRMDQYLRVNWSMLSALATAWTDDGVPPALKRYLMHYAEIVCATSSFLLVREGTPEACARRDAFWAELRRENPWLHRHLRRSPLARLSNLPGRPGRGLTRLAYRTAQRVVGFN